MKLLPTAFTSFSIGLSIFRLTHLLLFLPLFLLRRRICSVIFDLFDLRVDLAGHIKEHLPDELRHRYPLHDLLPVAGDLRETLLVKVLN